jgi:hypothetical protein
VDLRHAEVTLGVVVGERDMGAGREAQYRVLVFGKILKQISAGRLGGPAAPGRPVGRAPQSVKELPLAKLNGKHLKALLTSNIFWKR